MRVVITAVAASELTTVPKPIQRRIRGVVSRLVKWPAVSGAKPLRGDLQGSWRIRTGDYRVVFTLGVNSKTGEAQVVIWKIGYRGSVYE